MPDAFEELNEQTIDLIEEIGSEFLELYFWSLTMLQGHLKALSCIQSGNRPNFAQYM